MNIPENEMKEGKRSSTDVTVDGSRQKAGSTCVRM